MISCNLITQINLDFYRNGKSAGVLKTNTLNQSVDRIRQRIVTPELINRSIRRENDHFNLLIPCDWHSNLQTGISREFD